MHAQVNSFIFHVSSCFKACTYKGVHGCGRSQRSPNKMMFFLGPKNRPIRGVPVIKKNIISFRILQIRENFFKNSARFAISEFEKHISILMSFFFGNKQPASLFLFSECLPFMLSNEASFILSCFFR